MKIFFDTEFIDLVNTVLPISIGLVREDGKTYYAEVFDTISHYNKAVPWVKNNVIKKLTGPVKPVTLICDEIEDFVGKNPEFWAYFAAYDWFCLCSLYRGMLNLPENWPNFCRELMQLKMDKIEKHGAIATLIPRQDSDEHHALNDALWNLKIYQYLQNLDSQESVK